MVDSFPDLFQVVLVALGLVGLVQGFLLLLLTRENTRFFRSRLRSPVPRDYTPTVELFVPCKGLDPNFADTLKALLRLDYPSYSVTFIVESRNDPAYFRLKDLPARRGLVPVRLVVGNVARDCGQKVQNLVSATANLAKKTEVLAFLDSDAVPDEDWLRRLVDPLRQESCGAVTGYRWFLAAPGDWPGAVLSALNSTVAFVLGNHAWNQVWGGSWAIRRSTFEQLRREATWRGALTEDYPVGHLVRRLGQRVAYEPNCLVASPVRGSWAGLVEFGRRQYLITRFYDPALWRFALLTTALAQGVLWGAAALALLDWAAGRPAVWPALLATALFGLHTARAWLRQREAARRFPGRSAGRGRASWLDLLAHPLLGLGHLFLLLASGFGRGVTWRAIRYRLHGPHRTEILYHPGAPGGAPSDRGRKACA